MREAYGFNQISFDHGSIKGNGSGQTIAIVDAYNDPNIANDLKAFDRYFDLPSANLTVLNQNGGTKLPGTDRSGGWELEESLDIEWAHAMAPEAKIVLIEANNDDFFNLLSAVRTAARLPGVSVVSMSWGNNESADETNYDRYFTTPSGHTGVTFVAASGDNGAPPSHPAVSPNVLSVGGTMLWLNGQGRYESESAWSDSGGGISLYEAQPSYQKGVVSQSKTKRTNPDVAYDADPKTGFAVYDSYRVSGHSGPWLDVGGTSAGAPTRRGMSPLSITLFPVAKKTVCKGNSGAISDRPSSRWRQIVAVNAASRAEPPNAVAMLSKSMSRSPARATEVMRFRNSSSWSGKAVRLIGRPVAISAIRSASNDLPAPGEFPSNRKSGHGPTKAERATAVRTAASHTAE
jgi:hypothetical protein